VDLPESNSYTNELSIKGNKEIAKKIAEEANELAISSVTNDGRILDEAADLLFHLQVLLVTNDYSLSDVEDVLEKRNKSQ
jgi:phosphoribosyl-ATP pyrophosphohydrolase/phosphoribosyl-AMP cyclohydrolase